VEQDGVWQQAELEAIRTAFAPELAAREAGSWHVGATEMGDPQFYLLGAPPEEACIVSISRLGRLYVLEDGAGRVMFEHVNLRRLTDRAKEILRGARSGIIASLAVMFGAIRNTFHERVEPLMAEGEEFLLHFAPQLAAFI
jgi:hypothetical protein